MAGSTLEDGEESPSRLQALQQEREILMAGIKLGEELTALRGTNTELRERVQALRQENKALHSLAVQKKGDQSLDSTQSTSAPLGSTRLPSETEEVMLRYELEKLKDEHSYLRTQQAALDDEILRLTRDLSPDPKSAAPAPPTPPQGELTGDIVCEYGPLRREHTELKKENDRLITELSSFEWSFDDYVGTEGSEELRREVLAAMLRASFFPGGTSPRKMAAHEATNAALDAFSAELGGFDELTSQGAGVDGYASMGSTVPVEEDPFPPPPPAQEDLLAAEAQGVEPAQEQAPVVSSVESSATPTAESNTVPTVASTTEPASASSAPAAASTAVAPTPVSAPPVEEERVIELPKPKEIPPEERASATREELEKLRSVAPKHKGAKF